jgi:hypothetical protein
MAEWRNGGMAEMAEMTEWQNGRMAEWQNGQLRVYFCDNMIRT